MSTFKTMSESTEVIELVLKNINSNSTDFHAELFSHFTDIDWSPSWLDTQTIWNLIKPAQGVISPLRTEGSAC